MKKIAIVRFILVVSFSMLSLVVKAQHQGHMVLNDERMRPVQVLSTSGTKEWEVSYRPFGEVAVVQDTLNLGKTFGFAGQWFDGESGFYYNYYRDYDPRLGRYTQPDPLGVLGGASLYSYVGANPFKYTDPFGLIKTPSGKECRIGESRVFCESTDDDKEKSCEQKAEEAYEQCRSSYKALENSCKTYLSALGGYAGGRLSGGLKVANKAAGTGAAIAGGLKLSEIICGGIDSSVNTKSFCEVVKNNALNKCNDELCEMP